MAAVLILSMDVSFGDWRIRRAINDVVGIEDVDVYPNTSRVVVTGSADPDEVVMKLRTRLDTPVVTVSYRAPKFEISSADEDESSDDSDESSGSDDDDGDQPPREWSGKRTPQPWWEDQPVQDPTLYF